MTYVYNDPAEFKNDVIRGFAAAYPQYVQRVPDASGFVRAGGPLDGKVSLVIGGGSGHYPSYNGVVGTGFADGAVLGDLFASPSAEQVYRVARAANGGAGVVLGFGNYAGDRLNFRVAADRLIAEGIDTRIVYVTDDIASASLEEQGKRRGIAGTFTVYKIAAAAAEAGADLDEVERVMTAANAATYSFGVAFDGLHDAGRRPAAVHRGCRHDGLRARHPRRARDQLRTLDERERAGRAGWSRPCWPSARTSASGRAAVLVNGLGATKYEELFALFGEVAELLEAAGVELVQPEVGELVTSLDMAGCSLTVTWLDEELERLLGGAGRHPGVPARARRWRASGSPSVVRWTPTSRRPRRGGQRRVIAPPPRWPAGRCRVLHATVEENKEYLGQIDAIAGDGDHGIGMSRGSKAAAEAAAETEGGVQTVLVAAGAAFGDKAGGTSGILWGLLLDGIGKALGNTEKATAQRVADAVEQSATDLQTFSKASLGDKTMLDALFPFVDTLKSEVGGGARLADAWRTAAEACVAARRGDGVAHPQDRPGPPAGRTQHRHSRPRSHIVGSDRYRHRPSRRRG